MGTEEQQFKLFLIQEQSGKKRLRSARTVELHLQLYRRLKQEVPDLSPDGIMTYLLSLYESGRKGTYLNDFIDTIHVFGRFKQTEIYKPLRYFPEEAYEKATMSDQEIERFLALPCPTITRTDTRTENGKLLTYTIGSKRWQVKTMFWKIVAYSGMRLGEVAHLTVDSVDFGRQVFLADGKTGPRLVPIAPAILPDVQTYVQSLETAYLFPAQRGGMTRQGGVINDVAWGYDFHQRLKRLGIKRKNLTPYSLRHSFITRMLSEDVSLPKVQKMVGHRRIDTTMRYTHLTTKDIVKAISKDPLGLKHLSYNERFQHFRDNVRLLLEQCCENHYEESRMVQDLTNSI